MALYVEKELSDLNGNGRGHAVFEAWRQVVPQSVVFGEILYQSGKLRQMRDSGSPVQEMIDELAHQVQ